MNIIIVIEYHHHNCKRRFNSDIMKLYILAIDQARKLTSSIYVHLPFTNKVSQYLYAKVILCNVGEVYIFGAWVLHLSFGTN